MTQQGIGAETISYHPGKGTQNARYYSQSHCLLPGIGIRNLSPNGAGQELGFEETSAENSVVGRSVSYGYDAFGRLGSVTDGGETFLYSYHPGSSLIETIQSRVGVTTKFRESRAYNPMGRLTSISSFRMEGSTVMAPISTYSYQYDSIGRRVKSTLQDNSFWDYGYNDRSEVVSATRKTSTAVTVPALSATYSFDGLGNRLSSNSPMLGNFTYSPDSTNRYASIVTGNTRTVAGRAPLNWNIQINGAAPDSRIGEFYFKSLSVANQVSPVWQEVVTRRDTGFPRFDQHLWFPTQTVNPTYDDDGNLTGDGRWVYFWDAENRLSYMETSPTAFSAGHPVWQVQFVYDWQGRRIARHVWRGAGGLQSWTVKSDRWLYDGWNVVAEFSAPDPASVNLTRSKTYTWGLDLSGTLQGAGGVGGLLSVTSHLPLLTSYYPSYDGNGNIIAWTQNDANSPTARREYDAFGNTLISEGSAPCDFGFSTKMREDVTGLYYYGYRFYDPAVGRWPSRDPIEEKGGINLYGFVNNAGVNYFDELGQKLSKVKNSDVRIELKAKPVPYHGRSEGGEVTATFNSQASGSGTPFWFTIKLPGLLEISGWAYSDEDGALAHEEKHVKLFVEDWNTFVDEVNWTEKTFCHCGAETLNWLGTRQHLRFLESYKRNLDFDKTDYTARGVGPGGMADLAKKIVTNNADLAAAKVADDGATKARTDCEKKAGY